MIALVVTSLVRNRLGHRTWRRIHWTAYACWPVALAHGLGAGTDRGTIWVFGITVICVVHRGGGDHLALRHRRAGRCPVTAVALTSYRAPEMRLPRLLAGVSYYQAAGLAEHEQMYGPIPLPGRPPRGTVGTAAAGAAHRRR